VQTKNHSSTRVRKLLATRNDTSSLSCYHEFTMNDDQKTENTPTTPITNSGNFGSFNKEAEIPASQDNLIKETAAEKGVEVPQELKEHQVEATGHDRIGINLENKLKENLATVNPQTPAHKVDPAFEAQAKADLKTGDITRSSVWKAITFLKALGKARLKQSPPVRNAV
jgi:hypothetical protein